MSPDLDLTNVIITGVGGQGNVLAARILASVALEEGYEVTVGDVYGITQRGGSVASHVRWIKGRPLSPSVPQNSLDILLAFEPLEALRVLTKYGNSETQAIVNDTPVIPIGAQIGRFEYPDLADVWEVLRSLANELRIIKATSIAQELGNIQVLNMVMLGALCGSGFVSFGLKIFEKTIKNLISKRFVEIDLSALKAGYDSIK
jgi:indolepyruvate ferredoxin oxidoreductase beta subunit